MLRDATSWSAEQRTVWWSDTGLWPGRIPCLHCPLGHHMDPAHWCAKPHLSLEYRAGVKLHSLTCTCSVNARLKRPASKPSMFSLLCELWSKSIYQQCSTSLRMYFIIITSYWCARSTSVGHMSLVKMPKPKLSALHCCKEKLFCQKRFSGMD